MHAFVANMVAPLNSGLAAFSGFVDDVARAIDYVAGKLGAGSPLDAGWSIGPIPGYAQGTDGHPGGPMIVGEQGPELLIAPAGTKVLSAPKTAALLAQGFPGYAGGIGDFFSGIGTWFSDKADAILSDVMKAIPSFSLAGSLSAIPGALIPKIQDWITSWLKSKLPSPPTTKTGGSAGAGEAVSVPGSVADWLNAAIALTGVPASWLGSLEAIAMFESGGNPNAINNTDINAQEGHPSQGLMQTIPSTFAAYMVAGHGNILNPIDNAAAAINYIKAVYGSVTNVPGIRNMAAGGGYIGYASGTDNAPGGMAMVGEQGPELMYVPQGAQITPNSKLNQVSSWGSNLVKMFSDSIKGAGSFAAMAAQSVLTEVEDYMGFYSPAKKGPGAKADLWGANLVKQFASDIKSKTPEAKLAAENMMIALQSAITNATLTYNQEKLVGNYKGAANTKLDLNNLNTQMNSYKLLVNQAHDTLNTKNTSSPINFGGQSIDDIVAMVGVNQFTKDIKTNTIKTQSDAQNLFANLLKNLDAFAGKIAMAQLQGNTTLVNTLQSQQTAMQTQETALEYIAKQRGIAVDTNNLKTPLSGFAGASDRGSSTINAAFLKDITAGTTASFADAQKQYTSLLVKDHDFSVEYAKAKLAHNAKMEQTALASATKNWQQLEGFQDILKSLGISFTSYTGKAGTNYLSPINFGAYNPASSASSNSSGSSSSGSSGSSDAAINGLTSAVGALTSSMKTFGNNFSMFTNISNRISADVDRINNKIPVGLKATPTTTQPSGPITIIMNLDGKTVGKAILPYIANGIRYAVGAKA